MEIKSPKENLLENFLHFGEKYIPLIDLNATTGNLRIKGTSLQGSNPIFLEIFNRLKEWLNAYSKNPAKKTLFYIDVPIMGTGSSKRFLELLMILEKIHKEGQSIKVYWFYQKEDEDTLESGEDYESLVRIPFKFIEMPHKNRIEATPSLPFFLCDYESGLFKFGEMLNKEDELQIEKYFEIVSKFILYIKAFPVKYLILNFRFHNVSPKDTFILKVLEMFNSLYEEGCEIIVKLGYRHHSDRNIQQALETCRLRFPYHFEAYLNYNLIHEDL